MNVDRANELAVKPPLDLSCGQEVSTITLGKVESSISRIERGKNGLWLARLNRYGT